MKIKETKVLQEQRLNEISTEKGIHYDSLKSLLESVRTKKLLKRKSDMLDCIARSQRLHCW